MRKYGITGTVLLLAAMVALPAPALSCTIASAMTPYLSQRLPSVPEGAVAASVEILSYGHSPNTVRIRARIISMLHGSYPGSTMFIAPDFVTSCDEYPKTGEIGIVIGTIISSSPEALIIDPIRAPSRIEQERAR